MQILKALSDQWLEAKTLERDAAERRRLIEDEMRKAMKIAQDEDGTVKQKVDGYVIKANCRINRKVDPEKLLTLADAAGINIQPFTRWKAELIMSGWKEQSDEVRSILAPAITSEPGRPTFSVEISE